MEIRVFKSMQAYTSNKPFLVSKIASPDTFDFSKCLETFRCIYGSEIVIVFLCV